MCCGYSKEPSQYNFMLKKFAYLDMKWFNRKNIKARYMKNYFCNKGQHEV